MSDRIITGDYRQAFAAQCRESSAWLWDTLITDPPFGGRTHDGARTCADHDTQGVVAYDRWTPEDVAEFVEWAEPRTRRWIVPMTSHDLIPAWEEAFEEAGWYVFSPVTVQMPGMGVRKQGDGPASWSIYLVPARARTRERMANPCSNGTALWRALPGSYSWKPGRRPHGQGYDKPVAGLEELVRDYSNPGDLICDPLAGYGSTLIASVRIGRQAIGSEIDPKVAKAANKALANTIRWADYHAARKAAGDRPGA